MEKLYGPERFSFLIKKEIIDKIPVSDETFKFRPSPFGQDYVYEDFDRETYSTARSLDPIGKRFLEFRLRSRLR